MDLLKQLHHQRSYNPTSSDEAMVLFNSIWCGPQSEIVNIGNSRHWHRGCKAKCYLLVLFMAMPEAWWYLVYL